MGVISVVLTGFLIALCTPFIWMGAIFCMKLGGRKEAERALPLASKLSGDDDHPTVLLQIPCFNEEAFVERAVLAVRSLRWPAERLRIQIIDDSTDRTTTLAERAAEKVRHSGIDISILHRKSREGYKAGALNAGLSESVAQYVAILDVDYLAPSNWLDRCVGALIADQNLAYVQYRIGFANRYANWLTRSQALLLDGQNVVEQTARTMCGLFVPFGGTGGVWRREAIESSGGWTDQTITEDMDLSYRAAEKGWHSLYLVSSSLNGQLPETLKSWKTQQKRWSTGSIQVISLVVRRLFFGQKDSWKASILGSLLLHISEVIYAPLATAALAFAFYRATVGAFETTEALVAFFAILAGALRIFWFPLFATQIVDGRFNLRFIIKNLPGSIYLGIRVATVKAESAWVAISGGGKHFERTPK